MSDYSENLDFSPTRKARIAACEKLRDTVTGISALHKSLLDESLASSPTHRNSFSEIYRMSTQAMAMKKEEMFCSLSMDKISNKDLCSMISSSPFSLLFSLWQVSHYSPKADKASTQSVSLLDVDILSADR
ncbi:hypothetical protein TNIN_300431 [Trichonephila inaurata madagascariensis]|uniref:Uncharacterized protein n=1 Tax=Trichonephila inaurata madagascariensis TaxID=2747483 RepID=A0A8X7CIW5_9ARAC|nr:hypothetical protein TNIN_300431 [Trichonephila inaurata madagascariensis]